MEPRINVIQALDIPVGDLLRVINRYNGNKQETFKCVQHDPKDLTCGDCYFVRTLYEWICENMITCNKELRSDGRSVVFVPHKED